METILIIKPGIYQHYKGNRYEVMGEATHSENLEEMVVYKALYGDGQGWVRPKKMFLEKISFEGKLVARFSLIEEDE